MKNIEGEKIELQRVRKAKGRRFPNFDKRRPLFLKIMLRGRVCERKSQIK